MPKWRKESGETTVTSTPAALELDDGVPHEASRDVTRVARVRRRQDADLHDGRSRRANTAGATIASIARTKK